MKNAKIQNFIDGLITQDYILFGTVLLVFLLLIVLAILLRNRVKTAVFMILFAFAVVIFGPTLGYIKLHEYLFKNKVELQSQKKLSFVEAVVIKGSITNQSKYDFKECKITAAAFRVSTNSFKNYIYELKPFKKMSITTGIVEKDSTQEFKLIMEPFRYKYDYNISLRAKCR